MNFKLFPPPVYFLHIPKTAGSSFNEFLRLIYPRRKIIELRGDWQFQNITLAQLRNFDCYLCHFGPDLYDLVGRPDLPCITILRDPVERFISSLYYRQWNVQQIPHHFAQEYQDLMAPLLDADLRALLSVPELVNLVRDGQTRTLGLDSLRDLRPLLRDGSIGKSALLLTGDPLRLWEPYEELDMDQIAINARQRLESMAVVGITECFDQSIALVCNLVGVPQPARTPRANIGSRKTGAASVSYRATTPPDLIEQVEALTVYDRELYDYAIELFKQQYVCYQAGPRRTFSIAPRLLMPVRKVAQRSSIWLQTKTPAAAESRPIRWLSSRVRRVL